MSDTKQSQALATASGAQPETRPERTKRLQAPKRPNDKYLAPVIVGQATEYQLTDALNTLATGGGEAPIFGVVFGGRRYDTGDRAEWIKANLLLGVEHAELGDELREWVIRFADRLRGAADSSGAD